MDYFLKGLVLGFSIAAPVGVIGLLCIRRTLAEGKASGFVSGLGAATADAAYGFIAAFGLTLVSGILLNYQTAIKILGSLFLFAIAIKIFFSRPIGKDDKTKSAPSLGKSYFSTIFLTLTNPSTIISFLGVFAGLGIGTTTGNYANAGFMVMGVFLGSALWWFILTTIVGFAHKKITTSTTIWINRFSAVLMIGLGIISLLE